MEKHRWWGEGFVYALKRNGTSKTLLLDFLSGPVDKTLVLPRQEAHGFDPWFGKILHALFSFVVVVVVTTFEGKPRM